MSESTLGQSEGQLQLTARKEMHQKCTEGKDAPKRDLHRLETWADRNCTKINKGKILHLDRLTVCVMTDQGQVGRNLLCSKGPGGPSGHMSHQCAPVAKVDCKLVCIRKGMDSRLREGVLSFSLALVGLHLKYCARLGLLQYKKKKKAIDTL